MKFLVPIGFLALSLALATPTTAEEICKKVAGQSEIDATSLSREDGAALMKMIASEAAVRKCIGEGFRGDAVVAFPQRGNIPIVVAVVSRTGEDLGAVRAMLEAGADPNASSVEIGPDGRSTKYLLQVALEKGNAPLARLLLEHGANVNIEDAEKYELPVSLAVRNLEAAEIGLLRTIAQATDFEEFSSYDNWLQRDFRKNFSSRSGQAEYYALDRKFAFEFMAFQVPDDFAGRIQDFERTKLAEIRESVQTFVRKSGKSAPLTVQKNQCYGRKAHIHCEAKFNYGIEVTFSYGRSAPRLERISFRTEYGSSGAMVEVLGTLAELADSSFKFQGLKDSIASLGVEAEQKLENFDGIYYTSAKIEGAGTCEHEFFVNGSKAISGGLFIPIVEGPWDLSWVANTMCDNWN